MSKLPLDMHVQTINRLCLAEMSTGQQGRSKRMLGTKKHTLSYGNAFSQRIYLAIIGSDKTNTL